MPEAGNQADRYYSVAYDNYASGIYPEWLQVGKDGQYREAGFTRSICLNSPYAEFALEQIRDLVAKYDVDGLWLDIMPTTWHEFRKIGWWGELNPFCYCIYCRREYRKSSGRDIPMEPDLEESLVGFRMQVEAARRFIEQAKALLLQHRSNAVLTYNGSGNPQDPLTVGDLISIEGHPPDYFHQSMLVRWAKGQARPMEILSAGALSGWDGWDQKPADMMQLETAIAVAHGAGVTIGQQPYPRGIPEEADFQAFRTVFDWIAKLEKYVRAPVGVSDIGLYLSVKGWEAPHLGVPALAETEGIHTALMRDQWQYDILKELNNLHNYKLVIVGEHQAMSDQEAGALRSYVREGGRLLVTGSTSLYDERGKQRKDFALADVLGVGHIDKNRYPNFYIEQAPPGLLKGKAMRVQPRTAKTLTHFLNPETIWTRGTTVLWQDPPPDLDQRYPLLTENRFGKGQCLYISASIGNTILENVRQRQYLDTHAVRLLRKALRRLEVEHSVETTASGTEVVLNRHGEDRVLHVIHHAAGMPLWLVDGERSELRGVEVAIRKSALRTARMARELGTGQSVVLREDGDWIRLQVPSFRISAVIRFSQQ